MRHHFCPSTHLTAERHNCGLFDTGLRRAGIRGPTGMNVTHCGALGSFPFALVICAGTGLRDQPRMGLLMVSLINNLVGSTEQKLH